MMAWGEEHPILATTTDNPYRYVGELGYYHHWMDANLADFLHLGVRFYEAEVGRFSQLDPIKDGINWYAYVDSAPTLLVDPYGLQGNKGWQGTSEEWLHECVNQCVTTSSCRPDDWVCELIGTAVGAVGGWKGAAIGFGIGRLGKMVLDSDFRKACEYWCEERMQAFRSKWYALPIHPYLDSKFCRWYENEYDWNDVQPKWGDPDYRYPTPLPGVYR